MDFSPILKSLYSLWYLIPLFLFIILIKSAWLKGLFGEFIINVIAKLQLDKDVYHLIKNVTLPTEEGTTQIDHIIVSVYGVFVVETKNLRGWIFGSQSQKIWTQNIYKQKYKFQNPLHQNYKHVKSLQSLLKLSDEQVFSIIVFIGDSEFKTDMPENVTHGLGYVRYIKSKTEQVLSTEERQIIIKAIESGRLVRSFKTHREHVRHVKEIVAEKAAVPSQPLCPKCGSTMVQRQKKKDPDIGKLFFGCSRFPKCRAVKEFEIDANETI